MKFDIQTIKIPSKTNLKHHSLKHSFNFVFELNSFDKSFERKSPSMERPFSNEAQFFYGQI